MSSLIDLAEAVSRTEQCGVLPAGVAAQRHYVPAFELKEMDTLHVSVVPKAVAIQPMGRTAYQHDVEIDIGIQQRFPPGNETMEIDTLMDLVEQVSDLLRGKRLTALSNAVWLRSRNEPIYSPQHMDQLRQFTSVLTLTYRIAR